MKVVAQALVLYRDKKHFGNGHEALKVKCNEIWTNFLLSKNLIFTNIKKNQLFEISFVRTVALNTRKSDDFRELHENEPEMSALGVETNYRYL